MMNGSTAVLEEYAVFGQNTQRKMKRKYVMAANRQEAILVAQETYRSEGITFNFAKPRNRGCGCGK